MSGFTRPARLSDLHDLAAFTCGSEVLDRWLRNRALRNESSGASRTFVTTSTETSLVVGYYSLAASSVVLAAAPGQIRRNMPEPMPVILLGRLAVHSAYQGSGLGASLLRDAVLRVAAAAEVVGVRALLVHAIDDPAAAFYRRFGFLPSPIDDQTLFLPLAVIRASVEEVARK